MKKPLIGSVSGVRKTKSASKTRYSCPTCGLNAWAKPDVSLICGDCDEALEADEGADDD